MRLHTLLKVINCLLFVTFLVGCQSFQKSDVPATSAVEIHVSPDSLIDTPVEISEPYLTETPVPACVSLPGVELSVELSSANSIHIKITGLVPNESVYTIFASEFPGQKKTVSCCEQEFADENGVYEYSVRLRGQDIDAGFKVWQVWVIHSRGSTCSEFSLP